MNFLYSLYDALVSINVPSDKARAVVDAMERDMGTTLATKQDLDAQRLATKQDLLLLKQDVQSLKQELKQDVQSLKQELKQDLQSVRQELKQDLQLLKQDIEGRFALVDQRFDAMELRLTVKFGSILAVGLGLTIAALRLWS